MNFLERKSAEYEDKLAETERKKQADCQEIKTHMTKIAQALEMNARFFGKSTLLGFMVNK